MTPQYEEESDHSPRRVCPALDVEPEVAPHGDQELRAGFVWAEGWQYGGTTTDGFYVFTGNGVSSAVLRSDGFSFNYEGASFAALTPALSGSVTIKGYKDGTEVGTVTLSSLTSGFQTFNAGINGVDTLVFTGSDWRMSDFSDAPVIPEPATMLAGALLLLPFGASSLRILRRKT